MHLRCLPLALLVGACAHAPSFDKVAAEHLDHLYEARPVRATGLGVHTFDDRLPDLTKKGIEKRTARLRVELELVRQIDPASLDDRRRFDFAILENAIRAELLELTEVRSWARNPMLYNRVAASGVQTLVDREFATLDARVDALVSRLEGIESVLAAARTNLEDVPKLWVELAAKSTKGTVAFFEEDVPGALAAQGFEKLDEARRRRFDTALAKAVTDVRAYTAWLESDLLPRANGDPKLGADIWEKKLRYEEHVALDAEALRAMNKKAIERYHAWVAKEAAKIDPSASPADVMKGVTENHPTAEELLATAERYVKDARDFVVKKKLVTLPTDDLPIIRESPKYARRGFASMSTPGPFEKEATEAYYNITNVEPDWTDEQKHQHLTYFNHPGLLGISIHEAMPGHFVQLLYEASIPSDLRKVYMTASLVEGWAHYAEQMMIDEGLGDGDPAIRLGQLRRALQRHARWNAAIAIHVDGKSIEEAAKEFEQIAYFAPFPALRETRRATYDPTYLYYALGRMQILALRDEVAKKQGDRFSLRDFHDRLLRLGLPLSLAREVMLAAP